MLSAQDAMKLNDNQSLIERFRRMAQTKIRVMTDEEIVEIMRASIKPPTLKSFIRTALAQGCGQ